MSAPTITRAAELRAMIAAAPQPPAVEQSVDPMDWPLPCDVTVGHGTISKGCSLRTLVTRMKVLYKMATGEDADEIAGRTLEERQAIFNASPLGQAAQPADVARQSDGPAGSGGWQAHAEAMERERDYYRQRAQTMYEHQQLGNVWYWQGDGGDRLESLANSLPVVISADALRALIAAGKADGPICSPDVADVARLVGLLREAAATFRRYEALHRDKGTPDGDTKAEANAYIAGRIEAALAAHGGNHA